MGIPEESCPSTLWQKLPFLPQPPTPGFKPAEWGRNQYESYAKSILLSATAVNLAFLGMVVALFVFFLLWRLLGWLYVCCSACCGVTSRMTRRKALLAYEVMHEPWLRGHKVAFGFFAVGCIMLAVTGLATLPRPSKYVSDLSERLETASAFASSMLASSDGLLGLAVDLRPIMSNVETVQQLQAVEQTLETDLQCASTLLDAGLARPATVRAQIASAVSALSVGLGPALTSAAALLNATTYPAPDGATPALIAVKAMPDLVSMINSSLASYDSALAALPTSRQPSSVSDPRVSALEAAQSALDLPSWISSLDALYGSVRTVDTIARELHYTRLGTALKALQAAAAAVVPVVNTLTISLVALDTLYLGSQQQQQQQQPSGTVAGRACMLSLRRQLSDFDTSIFRFNASLERSAVDAVMSLSSSLEQLYGVDEATTAVVAAAGAATVDSTVTTLVLPTPLASNSERAAKMLAPLAGFNSTAVVEQCNHVQSLLLDPSGNAVAFNVSGMQSYLGTLRTALAALQQPASGVEAALAAYRSLPSEALYGLLLTAANVTKPPLGNARAAAFNTLPLGSYRMAIYADNAVVAANVTPGNEYMGRMGISLNNQVQFIRGNISAITAWLAASDGGFAAFNQTTTGLAKIQTTLNQAQALLSESGWGNITSSRGNSSVPPTPPSAAVAQPSGFLQPLFLSMQLIADTLSNGIAAVGDQLDNAIGKPLITSSPPPATRRSRQLRQSSSPIPATSGRNVTTTVRQEVVHRLDDLAIILRGKQVHRYSDAGYWSAVAVYSSVITVCLLLGLTLYFNYPWGLVTGLAVHLLLAMIVLAGAWSAAGGMVVTHDVCGNVDSMVLDQVSSSSPLYPLVRYYLQGIGGSLASVLRATGLGDTARLAAAADIVQAQILDPLLLPQPPDPVAFAVNSTSPWPGSMGSVQDTLGSLLISLGTQATDISTFLTSLLTLGDRSTVLAQYGSVTSWACCGLGGQLLVVWVCATGCGLLAWLAALSALLVLKNLDDMPIESRCGCVCYNPKDFPRPMRRRRYSSGGGGSAGFYGSSGGGACNSGFGSEGTGVRTTPTCQAMPPGLPPLPLKSPSSRASPSLWGQDVRSSYGGSSSNGGAVATATANLDCKGAAGLLGYGKGGSQREVAVAAPLFAGPTPPPIPAPGSSSPRSTRPGSRVGSVGGGAQSSAARHWHGTAVNITAMDPETASAFGYTSGDGRSGGGTSPPTPSASPRARPPLEALQQRRQEQRVEQQR